MHVSVFSVKVRLDRFADVTAHFRSTMKRFADDIAGFQGMLGLVNDETGDVLSIILNDNEPGILAARSNPVNQSEIARYEHVFLTQPQRSVYKLDIRYMPQNRPFPGEHAMYARCTWGTTRPRNVNRIVTGSRDNLVYAAIEHPGCAGFVLCSDHAAGEIFGFSMWQSYEHMHASEQDDGYYHRELGKYLDKLLQPPVRQTYRVFDRLMP